MVNTGSKPPAPEMPRNGRKVLVDLGNGEWFIGTFRHGNFVDMRIDGPVDYPELSGWYPGESVTLLDS